MGNNVIYKSPSNPESGQAYSDTVADYSSSTPSGDNVLSGVTCDSSVYVGAVVRISGGTAFNAIATSETNSRVFGICVAKSGSTTCDIQTCGHTNSVFSGLVAGQNYFLSDTVAGALITSPPTTPGYWVVHIGNAFSSTRLRIGSFYKVGRS